MIRPLWSKVSHVQTSSSSVTFYRVCSLRETLSVRWNINKLFYVEKCLTHYKMFDGNERLICSASLQNRRDGTHWKPPNVQHDVRHKQATHHHAVRLLWVCALPLARHEELCVGHFRLSMLGHGRRIVSVQRGSDRAAEKGQQEGGQRSEVRAHGQQGLGGRQGKRAASVRLELADFSTKGREKIFRAFIWKHTGTASGS